MKTIKLKNGLDIKMGGAAVEGGVSKVSSSEIALVPDHFVGIVPKVAVKEGDSVSIGTVIFFDKAHPEVKVVSPVSGTVSRIARGERRKLLYVSILQDDAMTIADVPAIDVNSTQADVVGSIFASGFGAMIQQRPYAVTANATQLPKSIFVSSFDTAPISQDNNFVLKGEKSNVQKGLEALSKIAKVYYSVSPSTSQELRNMNNVEVTEFVGAHPAGNVGVHINHLDPINKGEVVWTMDIMNVALMGKYINTGVLGFDKVVALAGDKMNYPGYRRVTMGSKIGSIVDGNIVSEESVRLVNGNILTGLKASVEDYLSPFSNVITAIAEGDDADELIGWAMPRFNKFSASNLYFNKLFSIVFPNKIYNFDARILGGERAFIMSGEYDRVFPMDIMPEQLVKAMITRNIDRMEQLGAYEVAPEDFALCEFVCTSKIEVQRIVREALDFMRKELE